MKQRSLLVLAIAVLLAASCSNKGGKSGLMVPKDAAMVVHINSTSLSSKISWNEIKQTSWFKGMRMNRALKDSFAQQLLDDPSSSGIDIKKDFIMFVRKQGRGSYMVFEGSLTSQAKYEQILGEMTKNEPKEIKKLGDFSYMVPHDKTVILWDKSKFAFVTNAHLPDNPMPGRSRNNSSPMPEFVPFESDSLMIFGQQALTLEGSGNLDSDSRFAELVKNGSDLHVWVNTEHYFAGMNPLKRLIPIANTDVLFKGNITAMSVNFDNGKITAKSKHYYSDEVSKIMANNRPPQISADVINRIPSSDVVAVFATNYSPNGLKELLRLLGVEGFADAYLARLNFSTTEFVNANKGEVLIAVSDPKIASDSMRSGRRGGFFGAMPNVNFLLATSVKDKAAFDKMLGVLWSVLKERTGMDRKTGDSVLMPGILYRTDNNWLVVSNSTDYMNKFMAGGNSNLPFVNRISGHPMGAYVDLQRIIRLVGSMSKDSSAPRPLYDASIMMWQDITMRGGDFKNNISEAEFEVNLVDKNTNSLKQLNQYMDKLSAAREQMKRNREAGMRDLMMEEMRDSLKLAPKTGTPN